jgi:hypothetical protein
MSYGFHDMYSQPMIAMLFESWFNLNYTRHCRTHRFRAMVAPAQSFLRTARASSLLSSNPPLQHCCTTTCPYPRYHSISLKSQEITDLQEPLQLTGRSGKGNGGNACRCRDIATERVIRKLI